MLTKRLADVKGVGEKKAQLLAKLSLFSMRDMLFFLPRDYQDFSDITPCAALETGQACALLRIAGEARVAYPRKGLSIVSAQGHDETGGVRLVWYNQPYRKKQIVPGQSILVFGRVVTNGSKKTFENADIEPVDNLGDDAPSARGILPVYPLTAGIGQKTMRSVVQACLRDCAGHVKETLPEALRQAYGLCEINFAIQQVHYPDSWDALALARRRLAIEDLFFFLLAAQWRKQARQSQAGIAFQTEGLMPRFLKLLPFEATPEQRNVLADIERDMGKCIPMNRLVQGDVGAGKTILALYALFVAAENGYQGVLLAPTEILARQHVSTAVRIFGEMYGVELLVGAQTGKKRERMLSRIAVGQTRIVIGTHALLQEDVAFNRLGVVITDEQHRFGVRQRAILTRGQLADVLIMSATPIPRTLTLILYGDLDVSALKGLPPGRKPVITRYVPPKKRDDLYRYVRKEALAGKQAYVVCALIEASDGLSAHSVEEIYEELSKGVLRDVGVALLHGRMNGQEKAAVIEAFRAGDLRVLVSTTVIEVGVDVPQATMMIVEDADRFGLAQLHQLRGRVGRGDWQSYCFLLSVSSGEDARERIGILCRTNDGFAIAQRDLELRGPGEFLGTRQSGAGDFKLARLAEDMEVLQEAQGMARQVMHHEAYAADRPELLERMRRIYREKLEDIAMN